MTRPSPMARRLEPRPGLSLVPCDGDRHPFAGHIVKVRSRAEHPSSGQELPTVMLCLSTLEVSLLRQVLRKSPVKALRDLADTIDAQANPIAIDTDPTPPFGLPRPTR